MARRTGVQKIITENTAHDSLRQVAIRQVDNLIKANNVRADLIRLYGYGDEPIWRLRFYDKVAEMVAKYGDEAAQLIDALCAASVKGRDPAKFFARAASNEFDRRGWNDSQKA